MIDRTPISNGWYGHQGPSKNIYSFNFFQIQFASKNVLTSLFINHLFFLLKFESFAIVCGWSRNHANVMWFAGAQPPVWWIFPRQFLLIRNNHSTKVCFGRMKFDGAYSESCIQDCTRMLVHTQSWVGACVPAIYVLIITVANKGSYYSRLILIWNHFMGCTDKYYRCRPLRGPNSHAMYVRTYAACCAFCLQSIKLNLTTTYKHICNAPILFVQLQNISMNITCIYK